MANTLSDAEIARNVRATLDHEEGLLEEHRAPDWDSSRCTMLAEEHERRIELLRDVLGFNDVSVDLT